MRLKEGVVENWVTDVQHAEHVMVAEGMSSESGDEHYSRCGRHKEGLKTDNLSPHVVTSLLQAL